MRPSPLDPHTSVNVHFVSDPVVTAQSLPPSTPPPPRGSRRRHTTTAQSSPNSAPTPPLDVSTSSSKQHHYDTRRKRHPLPSALHATASQPLLTTSDLFAFSASLLLPPDQQSHYVDWTNFVNVTDTNEQVYYYSFKQNAYLVFDSSDPLPQDRSDSSAAAATPLHEGFRAIKDNVPKSFAKALLDPEWGEPARSELNTIVKENNAIVRIDPELARQHIRDGAEVLYMQES